MKRISSFLVIFTTVLLEASSQNINWEKVIDYSPNGEGFNNVEITNDHKIAVIGNINGDTLLISKFDTSGSVIWSKFGCLDAGNSGDKFIKQLKSGNLIYTADAPDGKGILQKLNSLGDTVPHWEFGDAGSITTFFETLELPGGELVSAAIHNYNFALLKTDTSGNFSWLREYPYGSIGNDQSWDLILNSKGNFVLAGHSFSYITGTGAYHRKLMEINPAGDTVRTKLLIIKNKSNYENNFAFKSLIETFDKNYLLCTIIDTLNSSNQRIGSLGAISLLDTNFNIIWTTYLPGINIVVHKVKQLSDSSFVVFMTDGSNKIYFYYLNKNGQITNSKVVTSTACPNNLILTDYKFFPDSSVVGTCACGQASYIVKINGVGGAEYIPHDTCQSFIPSFTAQQTGDTIYFSNTSNGGYDYAKQSQWKFADSTGTNIFSPKIYVTGTIDSVWARLTATNGYGCTGTVAKKVKVSQVTSINQNAVYSTSLSVNVFPNPFSQSTVFIVNKNSNSSYQLSILNSLGEEISYCNFSGNEFTLNASGFSSGLYMYVLRDSGGKMKSGKLVVE